MKSDEKEVLNEAHVYTTGIGISDTPNFTLPAVSILRIDVNEKNIKATKELKSANLSPADEREANEQRLQRIENGEQIPN